MSVEEFRVDFARSPFLVLGLALVAYGGYVVTIARAWAIVSPALTLVASAAIGRYIGVVHVTDSELVLFRTNRARWEELIGARQVSVVGLPYLLVRRVSGLPLFVPLFVTGRRTLIESLTAKAPVGSAIGLDLRTLSSAHEAATARAA